MRVLRKNGQIGPEESMNLGKAKKIAVVISKPTGEYQRNLLSVIAEHAAAYGYYTLTYGVFGGYGKNEAFVHGERMLAELPNFSLFDGILLCMDTFSDDVLRDLLLEKVRKATCPVVCVRRQYDGYNSVLVDEDTSMEPMIKHLAEGHGFRDFCYVSGPKDHPDAMRRLACAERELARYGVTLTEDDIFYGDFWLNQGETAVAELLDLRENPPQAIICANDYMAMAVGNALSARGLRVPEDVVVTGFDDIRGAEELIPSLTTIRVDVAAMARRSVELLVAMMQNETVPEIEYVPTQLILRESCGCGKGSRDTAAQSIRKFYEEAQIAEHYNMQTVFMSVDVESTTDMDQLNDSIYTYIFNNSQFRDFFLVLCDWEWGSVNPENMRSFTEKVHLRTAIQEGILLGHVNQVFPIDEILPEEYVYDAPCGYYIVPLHYQESCYGYAVINYTESGAPNDFFQYIIMIISNVLERLRINRRMRELVDKLSDMYVSDVLTGLKNRYGFEEDSQKMFERVKAGEATLAIITIDMDDLKGINDNYGHAQGDIALKAIANSMCAACYADEICYRVGGDEFQVLALNYTETDVNRYYERFEGFLADYNARTKRPFAVNASCGHAVCTDASTHSLGEWMTLSDNRMYENKARRKREKRDHE